MRIRSISSLTLSAILLTIGLTGCTLSITDPDQPDSQSRGATDSSSEAERPSPSRSPSAELPVATPSAPTTVDTDGPGISRDDVRAGATSTVRCDGELQLDQDGAVIVVDGPCDHLVVNLNAGAVIVGDVGTLEITGDGSLVYTGKLSTLRIDGEANAVYWTGAAPAVTDNGVTNIATAG